MNNVFPAPQNGPDLPDKFNYSRAIHRHVFVNKSVDMNSLSPAEILIECSQFIERTEMGGGGQQIDGERLKDNPR